MVLANKLILPTLQSLAIALTLLQATLAQAQTIDYIVPVYSERITQEQVIEQIIKRYDWDTAEAISVANCESSLNPEAINSTPPDKSIGIYQINTYGSLAKDRPSIEELKNPEVNIAFAYKLWSEHKSFKYHWKNCWKQITS